MEVEDFHELTMYGLPLLLKVQLVHITHVPENIQQLLTEINSAVCRYPKSSLARRAFSILKDAMVFGHSSVPN